MTFRGRNGVGGLEIGLYYLALHRRDAHGAPPPWPPGAASGSLMTTVIQYFPDPPVCKPVEVPPVCSFPGLGPGA
jgi:hypothetical protein